MDTKYIFFTGGVVSSVGKGVTAARSAGCSKNAASPSLFRNSTPTSTLTPAR